jgi:hypothetical protein
MTKPSERARASARYQRWEEVARELSWDEPIRQTESLYLRILAESETGYELVGT